MPRRVVPSSPKPPASSIPGPIVTEQEDLIVSDDTLMSGALPALETVHENDNIIHDAIINPSASKSLESLLSAKSASDLSEEDLQALYDQFKRQTEAHAAELKKTSLMQSTSISAQIAISRFETLFPADLISKYPPMHRVDIKTENLLKAQVDLVQLSHIWSQIIDQTSSRLDDNPLRVLNTVDAEKICELMNEGLHRWAYWAVFVEASRVFQEGAMDADWWIDFQKKLDDIGRPNIEILFRQLITVGDEYVEVSYLEAALEILKALDLGKPSVEKPVRHDSKTGVDEEEIKRLVSASEGKVPELENTGEAPVGHVEISSFSEPKSGVSTPVQQSSTTAMPGPSSGDIASEQVVVSCHDLCLAKETVTSVEAAEEKPCLTAVDERAHNEELILQDACKIPLPAEEPACMQSEASSSDIMKEVMAALDAAVFENSASSSPESMKERHPSRVPLSLATKKSLPTSSKRKSSKVEMKRTHAPAETPSTPITRVNGWISAADLVDFDPKDVVYTDPIDLDPSSMSNKTRRKLPIPRNPPKSNDIVNPQPASKATELQTPARRPAPSRSVPRFTKPRVSLGKAVSSKPVPRSRRRGYHLGLLQDLQAPL
jgi:hypothetical protein